MPAGEEEDVRYMWWGMWGVVGGGGWGGGGWVEGLRWFWGWEGRQRAVHVYTSSAYY